MNKKIQFSGLEILDNYYGFNEIHSPSDFLKKKFKSWKLQRDYWQENQYDGFARSAEFERYIMKDFQKIFYKIEEFLYFSFRKGDFFSRSRKETLNDMTISMELSTERMFLSCEIKGYEVPITFDFRYSVEEKEFFAQRFKYGHFVGISLEHIKGLDALREAIAINTHSYHCSTTLYHSDDNFFIEEKEDFAKLLVSYKQKSHFPYLEDLQYIERFDAYQFYKEVKIELEETAQPVFIEKFDGHEEEETMSLKLNRQ